MITIVEGADLSGKTTAINIIAKHFNSGFTLKNNFKPINANSLNEKQSSENLNYKQSSDEIFKHYWHVLNMISTFDEHNPNQLLILDRFYPSQAVYSYLRGTDDMTCQDTVIIDKYCRDLGVKMIYIDTPLKDLNDRYDARGDEHIDKKMLETIKTRYEVFLGLTKLEVLKIDTRKENWLKKVEEFLRL